MSKTIAWAEGTFANVTEPFTVMLTNEAQQFATDSNRKVTSAQSYYTDIIVIRGSQERTDYTIGNITSGSGITVSKSSKRVTFSVSAGTTIGADAGVIEIPITLDGQTVKKQFSWSCGKQGPQGVKGQDGNSFAWNMLSETNCGKKHWRTASSGGKYSVESETTEDNIEAVKLICTESVSSSEWSYTCFTDLEMLKQLKPSTKYTLSYDIKANRSGMISHTICRGNITNSCTNTVVVSNIIGDETWQHISVVLTTNDLKTTLTNEVVYLGRTALSKVGYSIIKNLKLAEGDIDTPWSPSQSDIEGKGVAEIVQYYLATSQASGVTSSTSGWSTDITTQKLTADKKYLWNCYQTKYSDGTSEPISTPKVIGVYGDKGQKGDNAKNLTITPSSQYFKSTDGGKTFAPNTITIKPTIQGEINFGKWQYSIDGGVSFADVVSGQKGLTISNNVLTVSKDSSLYSDAVTMVTFRAVASDSSFYDTCSIAKIYDVSDIGDGRNLLLNTSSYRESNPLERTGSKTDDYSTYPKIITSIDLSANQKYTLQAKTDSNWATKHDIGGHTPSEKLVGLWLVSDDTNTFLDMSKGYAVFTAPKTTKYKLRVNQYSDGTNSYTIRLWDIKLEKGQSESGWSAAPEDVQTAILSTKSEISDVSLKVDKNKQAIEQRVEKTTYQQDLNLVKGDISKANEGLNKWRYEIYPKSLFASEYQGKSTMDVFAKNTNLTPSQSVLINDTDLSIAWNYAENYIGYALTFTKFSAAKSVAITFAHDDGAHIYLNGKLIGGNDGYNNKGESLTLGFVKGWNCIEVVVNEGAHTEGFKLGTTISALSECQLMNCYYGTPVARQSHITNQLVQNTTDIKGISTKVSKVTSVIGDNGENFTSFKKDYSDFKQTMNGFKTNVGQTYVTKDDFNGLEIGGRNLARKGCIALWDTSATFNDDTFSEDGSVTFSRKSATANSGVIIDRYVTYEQGQQYVISFKMKANSGTVNSFYLWNGKGHTNNSVYVDGIKSGTLHADVSFPTDGQYHQITAYFTATGTTSTEASDIDINQHLILQPIKGTAVTYTVQLLNFKIEKGNKATDYTPAPEDNEINGQNLVSNLPSNWEQGSINYTANLAYGSLKSTLVSRLRTKDVFPVSGNITISAGTSTNSSKEELNFYYVLFDINKKSISHGDTWQSLTSPKIINCGNAKYMAIILRWGSGSTAITPSDISQICLKIERGTSATPFTLAPEDVNGKIQSIETIATQTADKFSWLVKSGTSSSNFELTDKTATLVASKINQYGLVTFNGLSTDAKNGILNSFEVGGRNLALNTSNSYSTAFTSFSGVENTCFDLGQVTCKGIAIGDVVTVHLYIKYTDIVPASGQTARIWLQGYGNITVWNNGAFAPSEYKAISGSGEFEFLYSFTMSSNMYINTYWTCGLRTDYIASGSIQYKAFKVEKGNKPTDWTPAPEDYLPQANLVSNWTTNTTWIDGGKIYTGSITADKIDVVNLFAQDITASGTIQSKNYTESGGNVTDGSKWVLKDGSFKSKNLSWDLNGNLIASNANLSGLINATKGTVGGWNIATNGLYSGIDENAIKIYSATTYDAQTMYQKQKIQDSFILSQKYINHFVSQQVSVGHNIPYWQTRSFIYNDSQIQLAQSDYCINTSSASNYDAQYSLKDGYISATRIYMEQNITQVGGDVINSSFSIGLDSMMGWCSIQSTKGINIYGNSSRALYVQSNDTSKYNALETEGDVVVNGKIHAVSGDNKIQLNSDNNGSIELYGNTPFIDFHSAYSSADYTCRIIANTPEQLLVCGKLRCDSNIISNNDLIANSWVYAGQNAHYTWQNQLDCYFSCGYYNNTNNVYYYAGYHAFYVNGDSGSGMMYIETSGVSSRKGFRNSSDERIKQNFSHFDDNFIDTYMSLEPVQYQFKNDTNDKYHFGFKAQQTERILNAYGQESDKSYGICATHAINPEKAEKLYGVKDMHEEYTLAYDELIAPTTYMVQHTYKELESTKNELEQVKQEKADLEARLQIIEAKLGL